MLYCSCLFFQDNLASVPLTGGVGCRVLLYYLDDILPVHHIEVIMDAPSGER